MASNPEIERIHRETIFVTFADYLTQKDDKSAVFEFDDNWIVQQFLMVLDMIFSDYDIRICRTAGHPRIQVFMKLEEGLWKLR